MKRNHRNLTLFVVAVALGVWYGTRLAGTRAGAPVYDAPDDVRLCKEHLRGIYQALLRYSQREGGLPHEAGPAMLWKLVASGDVPDTPEGRALLTCPGPGAEPVPEDVGPGDLAAIGPDGSAYAVRDLAAHPLAHFPSGGDEPLIACDDAQGANHVGAVNVLYTDGSVRTLLLDRLVAAGTLPAGTTVIPVGASSPVPALQAFP